MPLGPKLILAWLMVGLVLGVFSMFATLSASFGEILGVVIQIALLIGLYTRQPIAWVMARWFTALGVAIISIFFVLVVMFGQTKFWVLCVVGLEIALSWTFFVLLGRPDSRAYFNAPRKA